MQDKRGVQDKRPFEGVRILDFTQVVSGPYCTQFLGLLGAEVIKVESRDGDNVRWSTGDAELVKEGLGATYIMFNMGKKSITLDLKAPEAKDIVMQLVRTADVVVENFRAGVMQRLGFDHKTLRAENPRLIYCSISGFGQTGPDSKAPAFDGNIQAMSGMMAVTGEVDGAPMRAGYSVGDTSTGLNAALAISAALYQRVQTGIGQFIDVAMLDSAISLLSQTAGGWLNGRNVQKRRANLSINFEPTADAFDTAEGGLLLAIMRDEHIKLLMQALGLDELENDPRLATRKDRVANAAFIRGKVQEKLMTASGAEWKRRLDKAGVPCAQILDLPEALSQPQVEHRGLVVEMKDDKTGRTMQSLNAAFKYEHGGPAPSFPPQRLGAQNDEVLKRIGYSEAQIADLKKREVI